MKFQTKHIAKIVLVAAISLSALGVVGAQDTSTSTSTSSDPTPSTNTDPSTNTNTSTSNSNTDPSPAPAPVVTQEPPVVPENYEENVAFNSVDLGVETFKSTDAEGNPSMDFYSLENGSTTSTFLFSVTQSDIAPYMTEHPAVNTLLASADGLAVYVLTTGEIQVNAGPDAEGKIHVKIFNGIPWTSVYGYTIDPVK